MSHIVRIVRLLEMRVRIKVIYLSLKSAGYYTPFLSEYVEKQYTQDFRHLPYNTGLFKARAYKEILGTPSVLEKHEPTMGGSKSPKSLICECPSS